MVRRWRSERIRRHQGPVRKTITFTQRDGWREVVSAQSVYVSRDRRRQFAGSFGNLPAPGLQRLLAGRPERFRLPMPWRRVQARRAAHLRSAAARHGSTAHPGEGRQAASPLRVLPVQCAQPGKDQLIATRVTPWIEKRNSRCAPGGRSLPKNASSAGSIDAPALRS